MEQIKYFYSILKNDISEQKKTLIIWFMIIYVVLTLIPFIFLLLLDNNNGCSSPYNASYIYIFHFGYVWGDLYLLHI